MVHNPNNRFVIVALRWLLLALGLAFSALNTGCGGGGGGGSFSNTQPRQGAGTDYLYLATADAGGVVDQSRVSGAVGSPLAPANVASAKSPSAVVTSPDGRFVYVADTATNSLYQYSISSTGALQPLAPSQVAVGGGGSMSLTEDGASRFVYAAGASSIAVLTVAPGGTLSVKASVPTTGTPMALASAGEVVLSTVFNQSGNLLVAYHVASDGSLMQTSSVALSGVSAWDGLAVDPLGRVVYVVREGAGTGTGSIAAYAIDAAGTLTSMGAPVSGGNPIAGVVDVPAATLYVLDGVDVRTFSTAGGSLAEMPAVLLPVTAPLLAQPPFTPASPSFSTARILVDPANSCVYTSGVGATVFALPLGSGGAPSAPVGIESTINPAGGAAIVSR